MSTSERGDSEVSSLYTEVPTLGVTLGDLCNSEIGLFNISKVSTLVKSFPLNIRHLFKCCTHLRDRAINLREASTLQADCNCNFEIYSGQTKD